MKRLLLGLLGCSGLRMSEEIRGVKVRGRRVERRRDSRMVIVKWG